MSEEKLTTREKILQVIEGMEQAGSIFSILDVAREVGVTGPAIHNRYPELAERIRTSSGVVRENDVKKKLNNRLGTIKVEKAKRSRLRDELAGKNELLRKVNSVNASLSFENISLKALVEEQKAQLEEERRKQRVHVVNFQNKNSILQD